MDPRRIALRDENVLRNSGGISAKGRENSPPDGESQSRGGSSDASDLVLTYSNHHAAGQRDSTIHNRLPMIVQSSDEEDPIGKSGKSGFVIHAQNACAGIPIASFRRLAFS